MPRKPGSSGQETKERILEAALRLFSERGFNGVSVRHLARAVDVKESSLYNHFPGKDAVITEIYDRFREKLLSRAVTAEAVDAMLDAVGAEPYFGKVFRVYAEAMTEPQSVMVWRILVAEQFRDPRANALYNRDIRDKLHADAVLVLSRMRSRGSVRDVDLDAAADALLEGIKGLLFRFLGSADQGEGKAEFLASVDRHIAFFWECVSAEGPRAAYTGNR